MTHAPSFRDRHRSGIRADHYGRRRRKTETYFEEDSCSARGDPPRGQSLTTNTMNYGARCLAWKSPPADTRGIKRSNGSVRTITTVSASLIHHRRVIYRKLQVAGASTGNPFTSFEHRKNYFVDIPRTIARRIVLDKKPIIFNEYSFAREYSLMNIESA